MTRARAGFSLVEMLASLTIVSLALGAMMSASMLLTASASDTGFTASSDVGAVAANIAEELQTATSINATSRIIEMTVPDQDSPPDGSPETLRYAWSGAAGDPLMLSFNGSAPFAVTGPLDDFVVEVDTASPETNDEILIASYNPTSLISSSVVRVDNSVTRAQKFTPTLPGGATSWKLTRVRVQCQNVSATSSLFDAFYFAVHSIDAGGAPEAWTAHAVTEDPDDLPSTMSWFEASFPQTLPERNTSIQALRLTTLSSTVDVDVRIDNGPTAYGGSMSRASLGSWVLDDTKTIPFEIYGIPSGVVVTYAQSASVRLTPTGSSASPIEMAVNTLNEPVFSSVVGAGAAEAAGAAGGSS